MLLLLLLLFIGSVCFVLSDVVGTCDCSSLLLSITSLSSCFHNYCYLDSNVNITIVVIIIIIIVSSLMTL